MRFLWLTLSLGLASGAAPANQTNIHMLVPGFAVRELPVRLAGARDVAEFATASPQAQSSFIEQMFHAIVKQPLLAYGRDVTADSSGFGEAVA